jgi:predicted nucleic acid-binding protein
MIHSVQFIAVLDTNVIYPVIIRDMLLWFAHYDLYTPKWSKHIFDEWFEVMLRKGVSEDEAKKRIGRMDLAFPDALVQNYENLIEYLNLPDAKDCHVLAAAIKTNAHIIVTNNIKDFPAEILATHGLKTKTADDFRYCPKKCVKCIFSVNIGRKYNKARKTDKLSIFVYICIQIA